MTLAPSRSRTGPAGRYLLSQAVNTCALEPVHFQPVFKLLPRSIIAETTAHCQLSRKMEKSASSSFSPEPLALSSNIVYLPKTLMASVVGVILLILATFNPYNTANWLQARLGELHMQLSGEQDDEDDELEGASHADPLSAAKLAEEDDGMDEEEREIARAAARYQLALESERLRVFGAVANASAPAFGGLQIDLGGNHNNGSHTQAGFTERRTMASMMESNLNRGKPLVLSEVPALPSWRSSRRRQQQQQEQQQESSPSLAPAPASSESSSALAAPSSSSSEASANAAPVEADEQETRPELAAHSSSGSSNTTLPAIARAPSSFSSTSSSSFSNPYDEEDDDDRTDHSLALSPTSTCALPHSDSQSELFTLYGPPLSPSFGPLDDAEDFARSALGSAAIAAAATFMASSSSAGSGGEVNPPVLRMLEEEERGLARLVRLEGLVDPDDFDLGASGAGEKDWGTTSEQRKRRRLQKQQQQQQQQQQRRPFSQVRRFLLRGGGRDGEDHEIHDDDDGETDVEREEEPLFRTQVC